MMKYRKISIFEHSLPFFLFGLYIKLFFSQLQELSYLGSKCMNRSASSISSDSWLIMIAVFSREIFFIV